MAGLPGIIKALLVLQIIFVGYDLFAPFYSPLISTYTVMDFLVAYLTAILDVFIIIGLLRATKPIWTFAMFYGGLSVLALVFSFYSNPVVLTLLMVFFRVVMVVTFRSKPVKNYFGISKIIRSAGKSPRK
jgi:hypothetical protein